ncbi:hypothetical protein [Brachybacterium alimentarium]|uniref:hypothetical protein n=1 Tax=Brachybacterium alimentarium TaxID=47845 RepID=UPI0011C06954|nr:hypothetical protein [Brachybacterium alimentarium]MDN6327871.1 hypothetical protein [Brachybacterium sp.]
MTPRRRPGRPRSVDRDGIGAVVVELGFSEATFAAVAERLEVTETTLFRHVGNRRGLMAAGLALVFDRWPWPEPEGRWRTVLGSYALALWQVCHDHPGAAEEISAGAFPPVFAWIWADVVERLIADGLSPQRATIAADLAFDLAVADRRGHDRFAQIGEAELTAMAGDIDQAWTRALRGRTEQARQRIALARQESERAMTMSAEQWFGVRLDLVLDGVAAEVGR